MTATTKNRKHKKIKKDKKYQQKSNSKSAIYKIPSNSENHFFFMLLRRQADISIYQYGLSHSIYYY